MVMMCRAAFVISCWWRSLNTNSDDDDGDGDEENTTNTTADDAA